jgi:hypothetical protein
VPGLRPDRAFRDDLVVDVKRRRPVSLVLFANGLHIGQVRDVLETAPDTVKARAYPTVQAAVDDLQR